VTPTGGGHRSPPKAALCHQECQHTTSSKRRLGRHIKPPTWWAFSLTGCFARPYSLLMTNNMNDILAAANRSMDLAVNYGVNETNPLWVSESNHKNVDFNEYVTLGDPRLERITRLRLLTEPGYPYFDISYVYGVLKDGTHVRISGAPMHLGRKTIKRDLIAWAKEEKAYAKGLGLLDDSVWSILR